MTTAAIQAFPVDSGRPERTPAKGRIPGNHGIWVGITCEFVEFLLLFTVYFVARAHNPEAFEAGPGRLSTWPARPSRC